jgi:CubicO group peptidase (beta-lactamase class C family)
MQPLRPLLFLLILSFGFQSGVFAQLSTEVRSGIAGFSAERLQRYDAYLEQEIAEGRLPGAVSLISRNGQIVHRSALGYSSLKDEKPMQTDQIFQLMSMTKPIITVAFMMLYEEGHFQLSDPVAKYLPEFADLRVATNDSTGVAVETVPIDKPVTIEQVLSHTAGFSHGLRGTKLDNEIAGRLYYMPQEDIASRVATLVSLPLIGQPGAQWYYSASPDVLALLIEHFSGLTVIEFLQQRLFDPLGMDDTGYNLDAEQQTRMVQVHRLDEAGELINSPFQLPVTGNAVFGGTHGLLSTADDYLKFCQMLLNGGNSEGKQYLSRKTIELMTMNHVGELFEKGDRSPGMGFGLGFAVVTDLAKSDLLGSVGQYSWNGAYCTYFFIDPQENMIAIMLTQVQPYSGFYWAKFRQMVYQALVD